MYLLLLFYFLSDALTLFGRDVRDTIVYYGLTVTNHVFETAVAYNKTLRHVTRDRQVVWEKK